MAKSNIPDYHREVCALLEKAYGKGYAKENPQLVGQLVMAAAIDEVGGQIAGSIESLRESLRTDHPLMGETLSGVASAIERVADAIEGQGEGD